MVCCSTGVREENAWIIFARLGGEINESTLTLFHSPPIPSYYILLLLTIDIILVSSFLAVHLQTVDRVDITGDRRIKAVDLLGVQHSNQSLSVSGLI